VSPPLQALHGGHLGTAQDQGQGPTPYFTVPDRHQLGDDVLLLAHEVLELIQDHHQGLHFREAHQGTEDVAPAGEIHRFVGAAGPGGELSDQLDPVHLGGGVGSQEIEAARILPNVIQEEGLPHSPASVEEAKGGSPIRQLTELPDFPGSVDEA
jgi:hypothetical protein